jgi:hypothetical protein
MKKLSLSLIGALSMLLSGGSAYAQAVHVRASIPFEFTVNNTALPAGIYELVSMGGTNPSLLKIRCFGGPEIYVNTSSLESPNPSAASKLVFQRYGSTYFLSQLMTEGTRAALKFSKTRAERQEAKNAAGQQVLLAAKLGK